MWRGCRAACTSGALRYSGRMFDVLVYLYENYWRPDACPDHRQLSRKLSAVGFESDEIQEALTWLDGLEVPVPDMPVDLGQLDPGLGAVVGDEADLDLVGNLGEKREVDTATVERGTQGVGMARPEGVHEVLSRSSSAMTKDLFWPVTPLRAQRDAQSANVRSITAPAEALTRSVGRVPNVCPCAPSRRVATKASATYAGA